MDIKIKDYIINNFKDDEKNTLKTAINDCTNEEDEETLPGMGVFLTLIWKGSSDDLKKELIDTLYQQIQKEKTTISNMKQ